MFAARQRASCLARRLPRSTRSYASDSHHKAAEVNESFGTGSMLAVGSFFFGILVYQMTPRQGEDSSITRMMNKYLSRSEDWEEINATHVKAARQAGFDRALFENEVPKERWVDVSYPEALQSHAQRNNRAGHMMNLDSVVEHYRKEHVKDQELKMKRLEKE
ncbi:NADH-ubiquinone oxidoreductase 17.8 kDa subunit [Emericellopsis atlantica]|uniref:NADH-ubiquinone oxidoreductase 17.8 kDa subunit n=1 Tax=Emericellopsis atlantica TaxID=2614577 RepID=A0A9P7ZT70_9HYPO|nr:NADH-ubiquinone oxidoreductase 17.8 kDa subunit [Emericellopsis atlantica]KAG9257903.1 NADH-ubiquinone oxidoreductase 17.8 kDa subunit [Emericellopsis atlantica]